MLHTCTYSIFLQYWCINKSKKISAQWVALVLGFILTCNIIVYISSPMFLHNSSSRTINVFPFHPIPVNFLTSKSVYSSCSPLIPTTCHRAQDIVETQQISESWTTWTLAWFTVHIAFILTCEEQTESPLCCQALPDSNTSSAIH